MHQLREPKLFSRADDPEGLITGTVGPLFVAYLISWALYGVLSVQSYVYYLAFPRDKRLHKFLVLAVYIIETADIILMTYDVMADFRNVFGLLDLQSQLPSNLTPSMQFSWLRIYILGGVVTCMVQLYYAYHLNLLQRRRMVTAAVVVTAFIQCCGSIVSGALQAKYNFYMTAMQPKVPIGNYIFGAASVICSIIVSTLMTHQFVWQDTEWKSKHPLLPKFIRVTVETGTLAAMAAITYFVLFFCHVRALSLMIPALVLSKMYANSLLVVFNSRVNIIRGRIQFQPEAIDPLIFPKTIPHSNIGESQTQVGTQMSAVTIDITTSHVSRRDSIHIPTA